MNTLPSLDICVKALASFVGGEVDYWPDFDRKDIKTKRLIVVPSTIETINVSRGARQVDYSFQVAILQLIKSEDELPTLVADAQAFGKTLLGFSCEAMRTVTIAHEPLYAADLLRDRGQFTAVIRVTLRGVE